MITEEKIFRAHSGPQRKFLSSRADIAIYGGAAGGGKTLALLLAPLRYVHIRDFQAVIFRRTSEQVRQTGGLWDESMNVYPMTGAVGRSHTLDWTWPSGATVAFDQLQHEQTKINYQGAQIALVGWDELTHFTETQFFYLLSRARSKCGVPTHMRATCNPDARSWVAKFIAWWIDQDSGYAIPERSGVKRWFVRPNDKLVWGDSREELLAKFPEQKDPKSVTFIPAKLSDNPTLMESDPRYEGNLMAMPKVERERLLDGNWKASEGSLIDDANLRRYSRNGDLMVCTVAGKQFIVSPAQCRRFATIDTAGTSREKAEENKGKPPSWTVCEIWDYYHAADLLFLVNVFRDRVGWGDLKAGIARTLAENRVNRAYIENAHVGPSLREELRGVQCELVGPVIEGMTESHRGAKLERAIASGMLSRIEDHRLLIPDDDRPWIRAYRDELTSWGGLPDETADQIDCTSYASYVCRRLVASWGGTINTRGMARV